MSFSMGNKLAFMSMVVWESTPSSSHDTQEPLQLVIERAFL